MPHHIQHLAVRRIAAVALALALIAPALSACGAAQPPASANLPAALALAKLLELRRARSTDPKTYALFFKSDAIPQSLAQDASRDTTSSTPPIPDSEAPYVSKLTSTTADVVVLWKADSRFPGHVPVTVFTMSQYQGRWVLVDARDLKDASQAPKPLQR